MNSVVDCKNICRNKAPSYATVDGQNPAISLFMHATEGKGAGAGAGAGPATGAAGHAGPEAFAIEPPSSFDLLCPHLSTSLPWPFLRLRWS